MGFRKELYTKEYFTGMDQHGRVLPYGVDGFHEWQMGVIRPSLVSILSSIPLAGRDVLELGYGRGESIRYCMTQGNVASYVGVDFSEAAYELARESNRAYLQRQVEVHLGDALEFMQAHGYVERFDAVFMLDVIEHIPTSEVDLLLPLIWKAIRPGGFCMTDTPFYAVDEDFIAQGFQYRMPSPSDLIPETQGMHCNKFTKERLYRQMRQQGFVVCGKCCFHKPAASLVSFLQAAG